MTKSKSNQEFQIGETVRLISGGPTMTVRSIDEYDGDVRCQWFAEKNLNPVNFHLIP